MYLLLKIVNWFYSLWDYLFCKHVYGNREIVTVGEWKNDISTHPLIPNGIPVLRRSVLYTERCQHCGQIQLVEGYDQKDRN